MTAASLILPGAKQPHSMMLLIEMVFYALQLLYKSLNVLL